jgi:hypothetical protein
MFNEIFCYTGVIQKPVMIQITTFKGIVQRILTGIETRFIQSVLVN